MAEWTINHSLSFAMMSKYEIKIFNHLTDYELIHIADARSLFRGTVIRKGIIGMNDGEELNRQHRAYIACYDWMSSIENWDERMNWLPIFIRSILYNVIHKNRYVSKPLAKPLKEA